MKLTPIAAALVLTVATPMAAMAAPHHHHGHKHHQGHKHAAKKAHDVNDSAPAEAAKVEITQHAG